MVHYWSSTSASQLWGVHAVRGRVLSNGTQVDMYRNISGGTVSGHYFLFEDISAGNDHFVVDHQTKSFSSGTANDALVPEGRRDTTRTFVIGSYASANSSVGYADRQTIRIFPYFKSFFRVDRANGTSYIWCQMQIITFTDQTNVYVPFQDYTGFGTTATNLVNTWSRPCNTNLSTIIATVPMGMSRSASTSVVHIDSVWTSMKINSSTECEFNRNSTGGDLNTYFGYAVVDWGGLIVNTGVNPDPLDPDITFVKSVENFRLTIDPHQAQQDLSKGQDVSNCAVFASQRNSGGSAYIRQSLHDVWLREPGIVVAHRTDGTGIGVVDVSVVEFYPDQVKVQTGDWVNWSPVGTENYAYVTISGVSDTEKAFVLAKWEINEGTYWSRSAIRARFTANDTVEFYRNDTGNSVCGTFFVVEDLADNFRVTHYVTSGDTVSLYTQEYHGYKECLSLASYATTGGNYYVDRNCYRAYQTGNGGRFVAQKYNATYTGYVSFQWVRFLDKRVHTNPMAPSMNTSTSVLTQAVPAIHSGNENAFSLYNSMQICTGMGNTTGSDDMRGIFTTCRFINNYADVEMSRETPAGVTLSPSYSGLIDWIGYTHPLADEKHQMTYAVPTKSLVRSVEKFTYTGAGRIPLYYLTKGQRPENCVPFASKRIGLDANELDRMMRFQHIDKNSKLTSYGEGAGVGGDLDEIIYVAEFDPGQVRVQQLYAAMTGTSFNVPIPQEVDLDKTFMIFGYSTDNWGNRWYYAAVTGSFISSTQLNFARYASSDGIYISIYLVECLQDQWHVAHYDGGSDTDTTSYDYPVSKYNTSGRLIQGSYSMSNANFYADRNAYRLYGHLDGILVWNKTDATGTQTDRHTETVDFNPCLGVRVGGAFIDMATGVSSETKPTLIVGGLDLDRSITFPTIVNSINRGEGTGANDVGEICVKLELTDGDTLTWTRYDKGDDTYGFGQWVEWPPYKTHYFEGIVTERDFPVVRDVACFRTDTNELMDSTTSTSGTGYYRLETTYSGTHYIVCQDDDLPIDYNHLVLGKMDPYPITSGTIWGDT